MIITIDGTDYTNYIPQDSIEIDWQLSDPVPTAKFDIEDVGSQLSVSFMDAVAIKPDTDTSQPTTNLVVDPTFINAGASYTTSGTFTITYPSNTLSLHCSNAAATDGWSAQTTLAGLVTPGTVYIFSAYLTIASNMTNSNTFLKMEFLDSGLSVLSTVTGSSTGTAQARARRNISGTAPANTAYIKTYCWLHNTVSGTNSATAIYDTLQLEAETNSSLTYPTTDCYSGQPYCMVQSNGTTIRELRYFSGYILNRKRLYSGNNRVIQIDAVSAGYFLKKVLSSSTYNNQSGSAILINLISTYLANYITTNHVVTTASDTTFDTISWNDVYVADAFQSVVKASGWDYFVDAWNDLHYQPPGYTQTAFGLSDNPDPTPASGIIAQDTFGRTVLSGWGTTSDGEYWLNQQGTAPLSVNGSQGVVGFGGNEYVFMFLSPLSLSDSDVQLRVSCDNSSTEAGILTRVSSDGTTFYALTLSWLSQALVLDKSVAGVKTTLQNVPMTLLAGTIYHLRLQSVGSTLLGKIWQDGTTEPVSWTASGSDTSIAGPGSVGYYGGVFAPGSHVYCDSLTVSVTASQVSSYPYYDYEWDSDGSQVSNRITVHGGGKAWIAPATTDTFNGNGSNKTFTLTNQPRSVHSVTVGGTAKVVGLKGINTYSQGYDVLVDKPNSQIVFNSAPASGTNNVACTYTYLGPALVQLTDAVAVASNGTVPIFDAKVEDSTLVTQGDAYQRGLEELIQYSTPITTIKLKTHQPLQIGDTVPITSAGDGLNNQPFMIQQVKIRPLGTGIDGTQLLEYAATLGPYVHDLAHLLLHVHKHVKNASTHTSISPEKHVVALEYLTYSEGLATTTGNTGGGSGGGGVPTGGTTTGASALTVYGTNVGASTLPNACKLLTVGGSPSTTKGQTKLGTATGWGELTPNGSSSAWAALGAMGSPTGKGFLLDATTLAGHSFPDGNWSAALTIRINNATSASGTITTNVYKRSTSGTYTLMGSLTKTSQTITTSNVTFNFSATEFSTFNFITGDKLYCDVWTNVTSSSGAGSTTELWLNHLSVSTTSGDPTCQWVSPGFN